MSTVSAGHYVLGTEGLALLRGWLVADAEQLERRVGELIQVASAPDDGPLSIRFDVTPLDVHDGYARCRPTLRYRGL